MYSRNFRLIKSPVSIFTFRTKFAIKTKHRLLKQVFELFFAYMVA